MWRWRCWRWLSSWWWWSWPCPSLRTQRDPSSLPQPAPRSSQRSLLAFWIWNQKNTAEKWKRNAVYIKLSSTIGALHSCLKICLIWNEDEIQCNLLKVFLFKHSLQGEEILKSIIRICLGHFFRKIKKIQKFHGSWIFSWTFWYLYLFIQNFVTKVGQFNKDDDDESKEMNGNGRKLSYPLPEIKFS